MNDELLNALSEEQQAFADTRFNVCELEALPGDDHVRLQGRVLDEATLSAVLAGLRSRLPDVRWDTDRVRVLRQARPRRRVVATNLTGFQREPSWLGEQQSQVLNGAVVEVLEEGERWSFVRLADGYLGFVYTGYLGDGPGPAATHMTAAPVAPLRESPEAAAPLVGRLFAGTRVAADVAGEWAEVTLAGGLCGYAPAAMLRPLAPLPALAERRARLAADALPYIGVPYLWGGTTTLGIDCSGFAQLMHKLAGVDIPRDADQQYVAGQAVEPPFALGDLLYFGGPGDHRAVSHVGISLGPAEDPDGWRMIHSSRGRNGVYIDDVQAVASLRDRFLGARRFLA